MKLLVLIAWLVATAAGWTFGWVWSAPLELDALARLATSRGSPLPGAPIRSTPLRSVSPGAEPESTPAGPVQDGAEIDFERLVFDDYDPPGLRQSAAALQPADFPEAARVLDGKRLSIVGFSQTLRVSAGSAEQLMVSRFPPGCCFGTVPVFDEWLFVELAEPVDLVGLPSIVRATGTLAVGEVLRGSGVECLYRLVDARVEAY